MFIFPLSQIFNQNQVTICWLQRDLRLSDNMALHHATQRHDNVLGLFIFDTEILDKLATPSDARVSFIFDQLYLLKIQLEKFGSSLLIGYGNPLEVWSEIDKYLSIKNVYFNSDFEPYALERDKSITNFFSQKKILFQTYTDHLIFHPSLVKSPENKPYTVYTHFMKKWKSHFLKEKDIVDYHINVHNFVKVDPFPNISISDIHFTHTQIEFPILKIESNSIQKYQEERDFPALNATSFAGLHLRFGTISIRHLMAATMDISETYINELIWREFFTTILYHFPHVVTQSFRPKYDMIKWRNNEKEFESWCNGATGYPLVDAGMRELNTTGHMHNRVRMVVASFLCKHLLIDWRWGEAYFAQKLLDFELASNNGNWQWAAGTGCDAAPYFRIFNPQTQMEKFDKKGEYVKKWIPELNTFDYPKPIVEHNFARNRCLMVYKTAVG